jgi:hypothetical protein
MSGRKTLMSKRITRTRRFEKTNPIYRNIFTNLRKPGFARKLHEGDGQDDIAANPI